MNEDLKNAIAQLKHAPSGKLFPCLLLLGSSMTKEDPTQWLINSVNALQKIVSNKEQADLFFMMGTHTIAVINNNEMATVLGSDRPSLEEIDKGLADAIKSLFEMVQGKHMQQETLDSFYTEAYQWLLECTQGDIQDNNPSIQNLLSSLQPLMHKTEDVMN